MSIGNGNRIATPSALSPGFLPLRGLGLRWAIAQTYLGISVRGTRIVADCVRSLRFPAFRLAYCVHWTRSAPAPDPFFASRKKRYFLSFGSSASRRPSPMKFRENIVRLIAAIGKNI